MRKNGIDNGIITKLKHTIGHSYDTDKLDSESWKSLLLSSFHYASEAIIMADYQGKVYVGNSLAENLFGYDAKELGSMKVSQLFQSATVGDAPFSIPDLLHFEGKSIVGLRKGNFVFPISVRMKSFSTATSLYILFFVNSLEKQYIKNKTIEKRNTQIIELKQAISHLKNQNERMLRERTQLLQESIEELSNTKKQLQQSLKKEINAHEKCSKFAYLLSHEYRNILTGIFTSLTLVQKYETPSSQLADKQKASIIKAKNSIHHLITITDELLHLNTNVNLDFKPEIFEVPLNKLLEEICNEWNGTEQQCYKNPIPIKLSSIESVVAETNPELLTQILNNLISNAIKYSDGEGEVVIECKDENTVYAISVKDNGRGIPGDELQKLTNGFYRASNTNGVVGNGLGLFIVNQFLEHLHGDFDLVSELNQGTCATIRIPKKYEEKSIIN
jgi:signal transduction histidine kinase